MHKMLNLGFLFLYSSIDIQLHNINYVFKKLMI